MVTQHFKSSLECDSQTWNISLILLETVVSMLGNGNFLRSYDPNTDAKAQQNMDLPDIRAKSRVSR